MLLIDSAAGAGALAAGVGACVSLSETCLHAPQPDDDARAIAAGAALIGGGLGLLGGILLTRSIDEGVDSTGRRPPTTMPIATFRRCATVGAAPSPASRRWDSFRIDCGHGARPLRDVLVVDAVRTPVGRFRGALAEVRPDDLGAVAIAELVRRPARIRPASTTSSSAAPTRRARTTATSRA